MTKFKKLMALAAVSMLGIQMMGVGSALAAPTSDSDCDFGSDSLEITLGESSGTGKADRADVAIYVDDDGMLVCDYDIQGGNSKTDEEQAVSSIDSITVEMDDDESNGNLWILLDDTNNNLGEWPDFDTFDIDITSRLIFDGSGVADAAGNKIRVTVGKNTFSFNGTSGTYVAGSLEWADGSDDDVFDASKASVRVYVDDKATPDDAGDDVVKGGSGNDRLDLDGATGDVIVYGNGGNDLIETGGGDDQGWGGEGADTIKLHGESGTGADTAAPGAGDDDVYDAEVVTYADLSGGVEWTSLASGVSTDGAAGDDEFDEKPAVFSGSLGDDVIVDNQADVVKGNAGDDFLKVDVGLYSSDEYASGGAGNDLVAAFDNTTDNSLFGNAGDDVLRGFGGDDVLRGGPGKDQAWGGTGNEDTCTAEVTNRCEYAKL